MEAYLDSAVRRGEIKEEDTNISEHTLNMLMYPEAKQ